MARPASVAVIFSGVLVALVLFTFFIPNMLWLRKKANEASAVNLVKAINAAERDYVSTHAAQGFTCSLAQLKISKPQLDVVTGVTSGYCFALRTCPPASVTEIIKTTSYKLFAIPVVLGKTGSKGFLQRSNGSDYG